MKRLLLTAFLVSVMTLASPATEAFVETPYITPAQPTPDDHINVHVRMGACHGSFDAVDGATLEVVSPGQLRLVTNGEALDPGHPFCNAPTFSYRFDIGALPAGAYTLQFFIRDDLSGAGLVGFGSVAFRVAAPPRIPATSMLFCAVLVAALAFSGWLGWGRSSAR